MVLKRSYALSVGLLVWLILGAFNLYAQPRVEIYWNPKDRADTVLDFGVTLVGIPIQRTITVKNLEGYEISILGIQPNQEAYIYRTNAGNLPGGDPRFNEFQLPDLPIVIGPYDTKSFTMQFNSVDTSLLTYPVDTTREVLLYVRVVPSAEPTAKTPYKTFLLRALKTYKFLASSTTEFNLDSVYVGGAKSPKPKFGIRNNLLNQDVPIDTFIVRQYGVGPRELGAEFDGIKTIPANTTRFWDLTYNPVDTGVDSATLTVYYRPNEGATEQDSMVARFRGLGVVQKLDVDSIKSRGVPRRIAIVPGDPTVVDFGNVAVNDDGLQAILVIANNGNINVHYVSEEKRYLVTSGSPRDTAAFVIERFLREGGNRLLKDDNDTLVIRFKPKDGGLHECEYVLNTDLLSRRISGVPDGAQRYILHLKGFGLRPQLRLSPSSLDFGKIVLFKDCASAVERNVVITNVGNALLQIDSMTVDGVTGEVLLRRTTPFTIQPGKTDTVTIRYTATQQGVDTGTLSFMTNALDQKVVVPFTATVVPRDTVAVRIPSRIAARPGRVIYVPVLVSGSAIGSTSLANLRIGFEPSLLKFKGILTEGTASEGSINSAAEAIPGQLTISMNMPASFQVRDTLVVAAFDTYLGNIAATELALNTATTTFGNDGCPSVLDVHVYSGSFMLDSVCALSVLTVVPAGYYNIAVFPNPVRNDANLVVVNDTAGQLLVRVLDATGRSISSEDISVPSGTSLHKINIADVPPGMYYVEASRGFMRVTKLMVVQP